MLHTPETPLVENLGLNPALFEKVVAISNSIPAHQNLNIVLLTLAPGQAELLMTVGSEFANSYGTAHGGIIATFADSAMGVALRTLNIRVVTLEMNINYFSRVRTGEILRVKARTIHSGHQVLVGEAEVFNQKADLVAKSRGTFYRIGQVME
jgi:acyl-CoA thioesterase